MGTAKVKCNFKLWLLKMYKFAILLTKVPKRQKPWHSESYLLPMGAARWQGATTNEKNTICRSDLCYVFWSQIGSKHTQRTGPGWAVCHVVTSEGRFTGTRQQLRNTDSPKFICAHVPVSVRPQPPFHHHAAKWQNLSQINPEDTKREWHHYTVSDGCTVCGGYYCVIYKLRIIRLIVRYSLATSLEKKPLSLKRGVHCCVLCSDTDSDLLGTRIRRKNQFKSQIGLWN